MSSPAPHTAPIASSAPGPQADARRGGDQPRATTCTYHCGACGRHFHSLASFDVHRTGDFASHDPDRRRRCQSPLDALDETGEMRLVLLTDRGVCRAYEAAEAPVMVWTMCGSLERARERWPLTQRADRPQDSRAVEQTLAGAATGQPTGTPGTPLQASAERRFDLLHDLDQGWCDVEDES